MRGALSSQAQGPLYPQNHAQELENDHSVDLQYAEVQEPRKEQMEMDSGLVAAQIDSSSATATTQANLGSIAGLNQSSSTSIEDLSTQSTLINSNDLKLPRVRNRVQSLPTKLTRTTCSLDCSCVCYRRNRLKSPDVLSTVLGSIVVGYKAPPLSLHACDTKFCRSRATKITYAFPQWLLRRAISVSMAYSHPQGPEFCLRVMRVCPGDADIFTAVFRGTLNHVQRLLDDNDASVLYVDPAHNTALHVSHEFHWNGSS